VVVIILQQIDANIINPKIVGNSLKINPILVILLQGLHSLVELVDMGVCVA
ncbi:MAG: AI-2E family transporter, partial [Prevotella sp.]|nr:AI-2E family transporter [Prevotella sp.]